MKIERILNILHYCFYIIDVKLHFLSNKINPFVHLGKIPLVKRRLKKQGYNSITEVTNELWINKEDGWSIITSGGVLGASIYGILFSFMQIAEEIYGFDLPTKFTSLLIFGIPIYIVLEIYIWRKDKYLTYFDEFEKWPRKTKRRNVLLSFGYLVGVVIFFFWSLLYS